MGHVRTVDADELHTLCIFTRNILVGGEIMDEAADNLDRKFINVLDVTIYCIILEHGNNLVVGLVVVEKAEPADWPCPDNDITVSHVLLCQDADVERVAVALYVHSCQRLVGQFSHIGGTICLREEAVEGWDNVGEFLRPVQRKVSGSLVYLIFYGIGRHYFNECSDFLRSIVSKVDSVPGMGLMHTLYVHFNIGLVYAVVKIPVLSQCLSGQETKLANLSVIWYRGIRFVS